MLTTLLVWLLKVRKHQAGAHRHTGMQQTQCRQAPPPVQMDSLRPCRTDHRPVQRKQIYRYCRYTVLYYRCEPSQSKWNWNWNY